MIDQMKDDYPIERLCEVLDCPRSSYYYQPGESNDQVLQDAIEGILGRWPFYGYRRVYCAPKSGHENQGEIRRFMRQW